MIAILLGPWAAVIAVTVALAFQALLFGDGGVLAFGVNVVNMAIMLPFVALRPVQADRRRRDADQPAAGRRRLRRRVRRHQRRRARRRDRARDPARPLPRRLGRAAVLARTTWPRRSRRCCWPTSPSPASPRAILTGGVVAYLQRANLPLLQVNHPGVPVDDAAPPRQPRRRAAAARRGRGSWRSALMVVLTPLGLLAPGGAFGEDAPDDLDLQRSRPVRGAHRAGQLHRLLAATRCSPTTSPSSPWTYIVSAVVGILVVGLVVYVIGLLIVQGSLRAARSGRREGQTAQGGRADSDAVAGVSTTDGLAVPRLAAPAGGGDVPVRVHRQAEEGQLPGEDDRRRRRGCCSR